MLDYKDLPEISCIYKIVNVIEPTKIYIGSASNLRERIQKHLREIRKNEHHNIKLTRAINKYGINNFNVYIIEYAKGTREELYEQEQTLIDLLEPYYNATKYACAKHYGKDFNMNKIKSNKARGNTWKENKTTGIPNVIFTNENVYIVAVVRYGKKYNLLKTKNLEKAKEIADEYRFAEKEIIEKYLDNKRKEQLSKRTTQYKCIHFRAKTKKYRVIVNYTEVGSCILLEDAIRLYNNYITINKINKPLHIIKSE